METAKRASTSSTRTRYLPRGRNQLHTIFERHFDEFCDVYEEKYAATYGMFRLDRIRDIGERFLTCGGYRLGVARIRCTNPACGHDYFRPFSCKGFYLCPSCSQKRTPDGGSKNSSLRFPSEMAAGIRMNSGAGFRLWQVLRLRC